MSIEMMLASCLLISIVGGIFFAKYTNNKKNQELIRNRLELAFSEESSEIANLNIRKGKEDSDNFLRLPLLIEFKKHINTTCDTAGIEEGFEKYIQLSIILLFVPVIVSVVFDLHLLYGLLAGVLLLSIPYIIVVLKAKKAKQKFVTQLPDAIDLIVSVLRTGHSIPRAIQTVSQEIPSPLGKEFQEVHQRLNLGQQLSEALTYSSKKYRSHELDLIRRAVGIQSEVGGSLAELLDKTNNTLRQRIKLSRHVKVLTSQSRLTAIIVGLLPIILGLALNYLNPGYLDPLFSKDAGKVLLALAFCLQILGIFIMRKLSYIKV